jgi:hypothetical protein
VYGVLAPNVFRAMRQKFVSIVSAGRAVVVPRTE